MRIRAEITLKNDAICEVLDALGWSQSELARKCGLSPNRVGRIIRFDLRGIGEVTLDRVAKALGIPIDDVAPICMRTDRRNKPSIRYEWATPEVEAPGHEPIGSEVLQEIADALAKIPERERVILIRRHGLNGHASETLEEIGRAFGVGRERIRQIESRALNRMRNSPHLAALRTSKQEPSR